LADALDALLERYASSALDNAASALLARRSASALLARRVGGALRSVYGHHLGLFALRVTDSFSPTT
jgi:hypothetical protein